MDKTRSRKIFPKIQTPSQNSKRQTGETKNVPYCPTKIFGATIQNLVTRLPDARDLCTHRFRLQISYVDSGLLLLLNVQLRTPLDLLSLQYERYQAPQMSHGRFGNLLWVTHIKLSSATGISQSFQ